MKLKTIMRIDGKFTAAVGDDEDMSHDAACAHALMRAMVNYMNPLKRQAVLDRADELMREWGFDSVEVE
jgi:hypothetical protein